MSLSLVVFSGLPGTGKSTLSSRLAKEKGWALISKDQIDRSLEREKVVAPVASYHVMLGLAKLNLVHGVSVVLDAAFSRGGYRQEAFEIAEQAGADFKAIYSICSDKELLKKRVESRPEMVEGWTPADWKEVERVDSYFEDWILPHLQLDCVNPIEENYKNLLSYIDSK